jgi:putative glutamine amidotransferase
VTRPPLIGIAGETTTIQRPWGEQQRATAPTAVVDAVAGAGGLPVVLPPGAGAAHLERLDGLVLTGGDDLGVDPVRDSHETALVHLARELRLPLLGLCRGLQVMAVATGGTLVEDLGESHIVTPPGTAPLIATPGSVAAAVVPDRRVSSLHHQSVATYDADWRCTATAPDGIVEAIEWHDQHVWPAFGVQWHPEIDHTGPLVFGWLVGAARGSGRPRPMTGARPLVHT